MAAGHVFLGFICAFVIGGSGLPGGSGVRNGRESKRGFWVQATHCAGARAVIEAAQKEVGVRELGENAGKRVDQYNAYVGFRKVPWCASFVSWCFGQAGYKEPKEAWSPALFPAERQVEIAVSRRASRSEVGTSSRNDGRGLVFGIYFNELKRIGHVGFVEAVRGEWIQTIEGNTGPEGSREGIGVFRRLRHKRTICKYSNWL